MTRHIMLFAGEASGDFLGARLISALRARNPEQYRFSGVAGQLMRAQGCATLFDMEELSLMGLWEVLPHLPRLKKRLDQAVAAVRAANPDLVLTIDSPGFNTRLAARVRALKDSGACRATLVHYVAPSVWAWKPGRAVKFARLYDHLLTLLPFEPPYFTRHGLATDFTGHPILESGADHADGTRFYGDVPLIGLFPGSRHSETSRLLPLYGQVVRTLGSGYRFILATLPHLEPSVRRAVQSWPVQPVLSFDRGETFDIMRGCAAALAASGTISLELALAGIPGVICYKVHPLTAVAARRLIRTRYVSLVNIIENERIFPEYLQADAKPDVLVDALREFIDNPLAKQKFLSGCAAALGHLRPPGGGMPSDCAATVIESLIHKK